MTINLTCCPLARRPLGVQAASRNGRPLDCETLSNFTSAMRIAVLMENNVSTEMSYVKLVMQSDCQTFIAPLSTLKILKIMLGKLGQSVNLSLVIYF